MFPGKGDWAGGRIWAGKKKNKSRTKPGSCWFVFSVLEGKVVEQKNGENPGVKPHPLFREAVRHLSDN